MNMQSFQNFTEALKEVEILTKLAEKLEKDENSYATLIKSALLLLTAKFEVFLEDIVTEYIDTINDMNITNLVLSNKLKITHSAVLLKKLMDYIEHPNKDPEKIEVFKELSILWSNEENSVSPLKIPNKFNYGKHGSKEVQKLFKNIELDIFDKVTIYYNEEDSLLDDKEEINMDVIINNMTNQRNNIVHQDKSPNMTHKQIDSYLNTLNDFSKELCVVLNKKIFLFKEACKSYQQVAFSKEV
ncbi:MAE_28990/MAE_18760 family HEPN-like nuclease [Bacillus sp. AK25]|uniref:MAE_28990/MAE_18760 family HEPN-like nuclease n=2 Tax=Bacillaceae TaxID=186817 RepID=UPI003AA970AA